MKHRTLISLLCILGPLAAGCSIFEVPDGGDEFPHVEVTLHLQLNQELPQFKTVEYITKSDTPSARYILRFFPYIGSEYTQEAVHEFIFTEAQLADQTVKVDVLPLDYHLEVWADWGEGFYNAADFKEVGVVTDPYAGGSSYRDAFWGATSLDLSGNQENISNHEASLTLNRPNARFEFIATDKEQFINRMATEMATKDGSNVKDPDAINIGDFAVRIIYPQFLPCVYNVHSGKHTDSATGVSFRTTMTELEDGTVNLGWDWVLANDDQSSVIVSLAIYDKEDKFISQVDNIQIPLSPGKNTTVRGQLLSSKMDSGISIDPTFDGEITVPIN